MIGKLFLLFATIFLGLSIWLLFSSKNEPRQKQLATRSNTPQAVGHRHRVNRIFSVSDIDGRKNEIPTGTELFVKGKAYSESWTQTDECTWLLAGHPMTVQHGELDPRAYCRFSVLLSDTGANNEALWPGVSLVCDTTPEVMHEVARKFRFGTPMLVHGIYEPSLDFDIVPFPGHRFGVPALHDCTVTESSSNHE